MHDHKDVKHSYYDLISSSRLHAQYLARMGSSLVSSSIDN